MSVMAGSHWDPAVMLADGGATIATLRPAQPGGLAERQLGRVAATIAMSSDAYS
jgi:hypothetical protein